MSQRLGGKDCRSYEQRDKPCLGRDRDGRGARIPCEHNGFLGVPLARVINEGYGRSALKEGYRSDLSRGVDFKRWKAPTLKAEGRAFKPGNATTGVPIGSMLSWTEQVQAYSETGVDIYGEPLKVGSAPARRSGQVWAACGKKAGAVWVAPDDGGSAVALCTKTLDVLR